MLHTSIAFLEISGTGAAEPVVIPAGLDVTIDKFIWNSGMVYGGSLTVSELIMASSEQKSFAELFVVVTKALNWTGGYINLPSDSSIQIAPDAVFAVQPDAIQLSQQGPIYINGTFSAYKIVVLNNVVSNGANFNTYAGGITFAGISGSIGTLYLI